MPDDPTQSAQPEQPAMPPEAAHDMPAAPQGDGIEQLLAQLSPEDLERLASELSANMQNPAEHQGGEDVGALAKAIEAHLAQNPEAAVQSEDPQKMAALQFIKSASYIEGFINHAVGNGVGVKLAIDMYDSSLTSTLNNLKKEESSKHEKKESAKHEKKESAKQEKQEHMEEAKVASYYDGVFTRAREYGFSDNQTVGLLKAAANFPFEDKAVAQDAADYNKSAIGKLEDNYRTGIASRARPGTGQMNDQPAAPGLLQHLQTLLAKGSNKAHEYGAQASDLAHQGADRLSGLKDQAVALGHQGLDQLSQVTPGQGALAALLAGGGIYGAHKLMHRNDDKTQKTAAAVDFLKTYLRN